MVECGLNEESKKKEGQGERRELALTPTRLPRFFFFLLTSFCTVPMIWTPGTGYAKGGNIACSFILVCLLKASSHCFVWSNDPTAVNQQIAKWN